RRGQPQWRLWMSSELQLDTDATVGPVAVDEVVERLQHVLAQQVEVERSGRVSPDTGVEYHRRADEGTLTGVVPPKDDGDRAQLHVLALIEAPVVRDGHPGKEHGSHPNAVIVTTGPRTPQVGPVRSGRGSGAGGTAPPAA